MVLPESKIFNNSWLQIILGFVAIEVLSIIAYQSIPLSQIIFVLTLIIAGILTIKKIEYGVYLLLGELIAGGLGYLLFFPIGSGRISLRLGLFCVVFVIWLLKLIKRHNFSKLNDWLLLPLGIFFFIFCLSIELGLLNLYPIGAIFSDFNGFLYLILIFIFATTNIRPMKLVQILSIGTIILAIKTIVVLFLFSHGYASVSDSYVYHLIRDTRIGEITLISAPFYRIFFQSHVFNLLALVFGAFILLIRQTERGRMNYVINAINESKAAKLLLWLFVWLNFFVIVISQSRSFWVAGLFALLILLPATAIFLKVNWQRILIFILLIPAFALTANLVGQIIINNYSTNFIIGRVSGQAGTTAISSRMAQLVPAWNKIKHAPLLGNGFGTTVRFRSDDPRIKNASNPEGWIDAPALEWGYLDIAVKMGILGLLAYLAFLFSLAWRLFKRSRGYDLLSAGLLIGLLTLMIVHIFTPYLNHPLGIGYILVILALI